jgi:hypothetical protein
MFGLSQWRANRTTQHWQPCMEPLGVPRTTDGTRLQFSKKGYPNRRNGPKPVSAMVSLRFLILCDSVQTSASRYVVETIVETVLKGPMRLSAIQCRRGDITFRVRYNQEGKSRASVYPRCHGIPRFQVSRRILSCISSSESFRLLFPVSLNSLNQ